MELRNTHGVFTFRCEYGQRETPKQAGLLWHTGFGCLAGNCRACQVGITKAWWTADSAMAARLSEYADAETHEAIQAAQEAKKDAQNASVAVTSTLHVPAPPGLVYRPFQLAGIEFMASRPATLLADEMGLGKSVQALGLINLDAALNRVLIVCPASLRVNWAREAARWLVKPLTVGIADSSMLPDTDIVIVNYDRLPKLADQLRRRTWDLLIADESHYCKSPKAQRSKALYGLAAKKTLFLTGTPLLNRPDELYPQVHYLAPGQFPSWWWYVNRYCGATKGRFGIDTSGATHLDELRDALAPLMIRRTKAQVLTELPPKIRQIIPLAPNGSEGLIARQWEAWRRYEADVKSLKGLKKGMENASYEEQAARLKEGARTAFADVTRMRQEVGLAKVPAVIEAVRSAMESGKVVCFVHHQSVQNALMAEFGAEAVLHRGGLSDQEKQAAVDRFQHDPGIKVFIGSIRASGVGLTLTASSHIIFAEQDWTPAVIDQCESRCHRLGQQESLLVQHLVFDGSLDATMVQRQVEKQDVIDQIMEAA